MGLTRRLGLALAVVLMVSSCNCGSSVTINSFTASPSTLPVGGGSVTLSWNVSNATSLSIDQGVGAVTPATSGSTNVNVTASKTFTLTATDSSGNVKATAAVCVATGPVTLSVFGAADYVCRQNFTATYSIANGSCEAVTVTSLGISAAVTSGDCGASSPGSYPPTTATVPVGTTTTVFNLASGPFCCGEPGCPATLTCNEDYTYTATTSAGTLSTDGGISIDLGGCDVICGQPIPDGGPSGYSIGGGFLYYYVPGGTLTLSTPGQPDLNNPPNPFTFANLVPSGTAYNVTITSQPTYSTCSVIDGGTGVVGNANVTDIQISCATTMP